MRLPSCQLWLSGAGCAGGLVRAGVCTGCGASGRGLLYWDRSERIHSCSWLERVLGSSVSSRNSKKDSMRS